MFRRPREAIHPPLTSVRTHRGRDAESLAEQRFAFQRGFLEHTEASRPFAAAKTWMPMQRTRG